MKKIFFISTFILLLASYSILLVANTTTAISINGNNIAYNETYGYPFLDQNNRTQVPLRITLESIGADVGWDQEKNMSYVTYNGTIVHVPIGQNYILVNGETVQNDTTAEIINGRTYCPIRKILEAFGFVVGYDAETNTVMVTTDVANTIPVESDAQLRHPNMSSIYTVSEGTGDFEGYQILHGYPEENAYTIYFKLDGSIQSSVFVQNNVQNGNEVVSWTTDGVKHTGSRQTLYSYFKLMLALNSETQYTLREKYGSLFDDYVESFYIDSDQETRLNYYLNSYIYGIGEPEEIDFEIIDEDWLTLEELESTYNMSIQNLGIHTVEYYVVWYSENKTTNVKYPLNNFQYFGDGFAEYNNIRFIKGQDIELALYKEDVENYLRPSIEEASAEAKQYVSIEEIEATYGLKFNPSGNEVGFYVTKDNGILSNDTEYIYIIGDETTNIYGGDTFGGLRIKAFNDNSSNARIFVNMDDFESIVVPKYQSYLLSMNQFDAQWISQKKLLADYSIDFVKKSVRDSEDERFFVEVYALVDISDKSYDSYSNLDDYKHVILWGYKDGSILSDEEETFEGIGMMNKDYNYYFRISDLQKVGLID